MRWLAKLLIRTYQLTMSPFLGNHYRFYPSCSQYAIQAIDRFGALHGGLLVLRRLSRCHPWHAGGFDPVPDSRNPSDHG